MESWIVAVALLVLALVIAYANFQNARPFRIEARTTLPPSEALDTMQARLARDGWSLGYRDTTQLTMSADRNADLGSTAAIGCISVWFGLLYALSSRRTITVNVEAVRLAESTTMIVNGSRSGNGLLRYIAERLRELPKP